MKMNKFDATFQSIKSEIISESFNGDDIIYYIDLDLDLINEKYCSGGVDIDFIEKNNNFFKVEIIFLDDTKKSIRLRSNSKQKIKALLGTFIDSKKYDEVCSFITLSGTEYGYEKL
jgi:hypothetical protein